MFTICIQVEIGDNISQISHILLTLTSAGRIGRTHVGGEFSENVGKSHLVFDHLVDTLFLTDDAEILMRPGVASNLVTFSNHTLNHSGPWLSRIVDCALANIDPGDKEGRLEIIRGEQIHYIVGVEVWSIVVGDGHSARFNALINTPSTVFNVAELWSRNRTSAAS